MPATVIPLEFQRRATLVAVQVKEKSDKEFLDRNETYVVNALFSLLDEQGSRCPHLDQPRLVEQG